MLINGIVVHKIDKAVREKNQPNSSAVIRFRDKLLDNQRSVWGQCKNSFNGW